MNPYVNKVVYGNTTIIDLSDTTATASDVLSGKSMYLASGEKVSGTIGTGALSTPTINSSGLITASVGTTGYMESGTSSTLQLSTQSAKTVTPSTSSQTAVASGKYTTGNVTVAGDSDLVASNIKKSVSIFGVTGTLVEATPIEISTDAGMTAVLTSANVGKCYKFTGTTGTYTNGDLYVVEAS